MSQKVPHITQMCVLPVPFPVDMAVVNPPERKLAKRTSVHCAVAFYAMAEKRQFMKFFNFKPRHHAKARLREFDSIVTINKIKLR